MDYNFNQIEKKWQQKWAADKTYQVSNNSDKPKYYVLDMFPYPSGAGLHVGHPLGYIASDIFARYKRLKGFNVLHPMGYDAFGLPAEQYAIEHGIHPAVSTENNINTFRKQLDNIGFSFDWNREVRTSDPEYYKWTQWIFLQLFKSWFNRKTQKAEPIDQLVEIFATEGNSNHPVPNASYKLPATRNRQPVSDNTFSASDWNEFDKAVQQQILMEYRLAYCGYGEVNWCEALGTVLANDEVVNGLSERGGHPVVKKKLRQWYLRITEYADRLLKGLQEVDFSEAMKEMQTNWIGKSSGAEIQFIIHNSQLIINVYTTRPDTIFGVDFMVIAPELKLVDQIKSAEQAAAVDEYVAWVKSRSERERMAEKKISGVFTGAYAINPFNGRQIPIWISEYVLAGYGTGAIMAVPCGDERDHKFAQHFNIPITNIIGSHYNGTEANPTKDAVLENSDFLNGMVMRNAIEVVITELENKGIGQRKTNYKMRDAAFSRQRYWGEPFPIIWKNGIAYPIDESELPLELPKVDNYSPGPEGEGPLANIPEWVLIPNPSPQAEKGVTGATNVPKYNILSPKQYELAKEMRKGHTEAEDKLWQVLRNNQLGVKFRRQHPIDAYIVDFISLQQRLIVEVDGGYHESDEQKYYDANRTKVLNDIGFQILRFTNDEVLADPFVVKEKIKDYLNKNRLDDNDTTPLSIIGEGQGVRETNTMPGYAGSSWYFLRYMDPHNKNEFAGRHATDYWNQVDLYIGGTEHAVGHLLYSRLWTKVLFDLGHLSFDEPFKRLLNQGMIQGSSRFVYRVHGSNQFVSYGQKDKHQTDAIHVDVNIVDGVELDIEKFKQWRNGEFADAKFILEDGSLYSPLSDRRGAGGEAVYICGSEIEKMSKSKFNTLNPDDLVLKYGADTFRMYEMFLGPVEISKPWDTKGIEGVHRFLKKLWRLFYKDAPHKSSPEGRILETSLAEPRWDDEPPTNEELKTLHKAIKKIEDDTERFSFNTAVSSFMILVNELADLKCHKKAILQPVLILLAPYAPHIAEELWHALGNTTSVVDAAYPKFEAQYVKESSKEYPISVNGKLRTTMVISLDAEQPEVETMVLTNEVIQKWIEGKTPKKIIYVKNKMVNVVV